MEAALAITSTIEGVWSHRTPKAANRAIRGSCKDAVISQGGRCDSRASLVLLGGWASPFRKRDARRPRPAAVRRRLCQFSLCPGAAEAEHGTGRETWPAAAAAHPACDPDGPVGCRRADGGAPRHFPVAQRRADRHVG